MPLDLARRGIDRHGRCRVEVVARPPIPHPWAAIAGSPEQEIGVRIVVSRHPRRGTAGLPLIATSRPRLAAWLAWSRHGEAPPDLDPGIDMIGGDESTNTELATRDANHHLAVRDERRQRHVVPALVVRDRGRPDFPPGSGVDGHEHRVRGGEVDLIAVQGHAATGPVDRDDVFRKASSVAPENRAGSNIDSDHLVAWRRDKHHAVVDDGRRLVSARLACGQHPHRLQAIDVGRGDLLEGAVPPAVVGAPDRQPVSRLRGSSAARPSRSCSSAALAEPAPGEAAEALVSCMPHSLSAGARKDPSTTTRQATQADSKPTGVVNGPAT